ncbi:MAG: glycosyltransferase family 4 protein [Sphingomicrobium sp.]
MVRGDRARHICVIGLRGIPDVIGGIEAHCQQLYPRLVKLSRGTRVTVVIRSGYTQSRFFEYEGIQVRTIWSPHIWGVDTVIHSFLSVLYARLFLRPDVIHLHGIGPGFFTPLARLLGMPTVVTHHARDYLRPKWSWRGRTFLRLGEMLSARFANAVICVSNALHREFVEAYPVVRTRSRMIPNASALAGPVPNDIAPVLARFGLVPNGYILAVGRLDAAKSFDDLIAAFCRAKPDCKLVIVGSEIGNEAHATELWKHRSDDIIFTGFQTGDVLASLYRGAALFVHPSRLEGYGLVIAEALTLDLPLIVSDIPPHLEFELPEQCYFVAGDVATLAAKLKAGNYEQYSAPHASEIQRRQDWNDIAAQHLELYRELAAPRAVLAS